MPDSFDTLVPNAKLAGQAKMTFLFWDVYDASLYAPDGKWDASKPYALTLRYLRDFKGEAIAQRSVEEMRHQGFDDDKKLQQWQTMMSKVFPDVESGTELTGILDANGKTTFYLDNEKLAEVDDKQFGMCFFSIWLGEKTSEPKLRKALIGEKR